MSFDHRHYVPILKAKAGELRALKETRDAVRACFTPLLEVMDIPPKYIDGEDDPVDSKSIDDHVESAAASIAKACNSGHRVFVDGFYIEDRPALKNGNEPITGVIDCLRDSGVAVIPVVGLDRVKEYNMAVRSAVAKDKRGACVRLVEPDLESEHLDNQINSILRGLELEPKDVDLLLDYGPRVPSRAALVPTIHALPRLSEWRSFTLASSSFPENMSEVARNTIEELAGR